MRLSESIQHLRTRPLLGLAIALFVFVAAFGLRYSFGSEFAR